MLILFAPLQGLTDYEFRKTYEEVYGGIDEYFTPFIKLENGGFRNRDLRELEAVKEEKKTTIQMLVGSREEAVIIVQKIYEAGLRKIDINMGCPFPKVLRSGKGAAVLSEPERVAEILGIADDYPDVQFSLKLRSGWNSSDELWKLIPIINQAKLRHVVLHPRTAKDGYIHEPDKEVFKRFIAECTHSVAYNGSLTCVDDIRELEKEIPQLEKVMIGRGLLAHPDMIFPEWPNEKRRERIIQFYSKLYDAYVRRLSGEAQILSKMQELWTYLLPEADKKLRKKIQKTKSLAAFETYANRILTDLY